MRSLEKRDWLRVFEVPVPFFRAEPAKNGGLMEQTLSGGGFRSFAAPTPRVSHPVRPGPGPTRRLESEGRSRAERRPCACGSSPASRPLRTPRSAWDPRPRQPHQLGSDERGTTARPAPSGGRATRASRQLEGDERASPRQTWCSPLGVVNREVTSGRSGPRILALSPALCFLIRFIGRFCCPLQKIL